MNSESAAAPDTAFHTDAPADLFDYSSGKVKAKPDARRFRYLALTVRSVARSRLIWRAASIEFVKYVGHIIFKNSAPHVRNINSHTACFYACRQRYAPCVRRVLDGIFYKPA